MRPFTLILGFATALPVFCQPLFAQSDLLSAYDTNNDGVLSLAEFQVTQRDMFDQADTNNDGLLSKAEISAYAPFPARVLSRDSDGDGVLTPSEFLSQASGFQRADRNNDGVLGPKELARVQKHLSPNNG